VHTSDRSLNLLRSVARLSADLGMSVAVEGIETEEQFDLVARESSVDEVQGFLIGVPMPSSDIRNMLFAPPVRISKVA
jgi:EAL domain-containing protein (putative c-di-GMP-specific phosphodiesterase class I)